MGYWILEVEEHARRAAAHKKLQRRLHTTLAVVGFITFAAAFFATIYPLVLETFK